MKQMEIVETREKKMRWANYITRRDRVHIEANCGGVQRKKTFDEVLGPGEKTTRPKLNAMEETYWQGQMPSGRVWP